MKTQKFINYTTDWLKIIRRLYYPIFHFASSELFVAARRQFALPLKLMSVSAYLFRITALKEPQGVYLIIKVYLAGKGFKTKGLFI